MTNKERVLAISKNLGLSHIGSNLSCLPVLEEVYKTKKEGDIVILDNAHAGLAHSLFLEGELPEDKIRNYGIHCDRKAGCDASGGSLGHGVGIGIGYALADGKRDVFVIVSEGSLMEGSVWEALRIADDLELDNLHIHANLNGYSAVAQIDRSLEERLRKYVKYVSVKIHHTQNGKGFEGVEGHYATIS